MDFKLAVPATGYQYESDASDGYDGHPPAHRRESVSSTEGSMYDEKDVFMFANALPSNDIREYGFYHPKVTTRGLVITDGDVSTKVNKIPLLYVEVSEFAFKKPDVILHEFPPATGIVNDLEQIADVGESTPTIGVAHFPKFSHQIRAELGDPASNTGITYVEVQNPNMLSHGEYNMSLSGRSYTWQRTHDSAAGVEGSGLARALNRDSYQLTDVASNEIIAVFLENSFKSWAKKGKLRIYKNLDEPVFGAQQLRVLIFLSIASILEKARRRKERRRG